MASPQKAGYFLVMHGKTCVVTGANAGIGKAMATELARRGADVVLVCRNRSRGEAALAEVRKAAGHDRLALMLCDVGDLTAVRAFAAEFRATGRRIDVLANNAGVFLPARQLSAQGYELMLAINHLGPFLLTNLLLDRLEGGRVVSTSSFGHAMGRIAFDDLQCERRYWAGVQYGVTKLCNILFTRELARRAPRVVATCFHPGGVATEFAQDQPGWLSTVMRVLGPWVLRTPAKGAETGVWLATADEAAGLSGSYCVDRRVRRPWGQGTDDAVAHELWRVSEELTGLADAEASPRRPDG